MNLTRYWSSISRPLKYKGGFSRSVAFHPAMVRYVAGGIVFGYVGWTERRADVDRALERHLRDELRWDLDATVEWLISRDGRGFADAFRGMETIRDYQYLHPATWDSLECAQHCAPCETTGTEAG